MSKEFILFDNEEITMKMRFYRLMDLLVSNKSSTRMEVVILFGIYYIQMLSGFFDIQLEVMEITNSSSDDFLYNLYKIIRVRGLLIGNYSGFEIAIYLLFSAVLIMTILFFFILMKMTKDTFYSYKEYLLNFLIKAFVYVAFNPILDITLTNFCFETNNPNFSGVTCAVSNIPLFTIGLILLLYSIFLSFFANLFFNDSYFLSSSFYSRMNCGYEIYMTINSLIYSILLSQAKYLGKEIFLIYNFIISLIFLKFYFGKYLYYDEITNSIVGIFHIIYVWTSLFFLVFAFVTMNEKGVVFLIGCLIIIFLFLNLKHRLEEHIILKTPYHKITNKYHLMFYLKSIIDKIHNLDSSIEAKAELVGIIQTHKIECPSPSCLTKHPSKKLYLPVTDEWSMRDKAEVNDKVFLLNFLIIMMNFFISQSYYSPEMLINLSLYYLQIIGNFCQAMFYYKKVKEMKLSLQENFSFIRLNFTISKSLIEKLRPSSEGCPNLEDLNSTLYFKYEDLSQKFFDEINNDINLSLEFWKSFKTHHETGRPLDFTKIFYLTDKIRITKNKIEKIWGDLYGTFSGVNDLFELYENYVEQINDDDMLKRELDTIKSKNVNSTDHIQLNYYNLLFNKETGIIIANGDKSKEGIIEKTNDEVEKIFDYKADELKGMNVSFLMPRIFERVHKSFMERYFEIGEKRRIDKNLKSFAKDKENSLLPVKLYIKLFPVLNDNIYYCSMVIKENLDDVILIDSRFNIQGISKKLMAKFELDNKNIFHDCDIPFYIICRKFLNFYKIFLRGNIKKGKKDNKHKAGISNVNVNYVSTTGVNPGTSTLTGENQVDLISENENRGGNDESSNRPPLFNKNNDNTMVNLNDNIEINENIELEYEICIPQFLHEYVSTINRRDNKMDVKMLKTTNNLDSSRNELLQNDTNDDFEENDNLVNETIKETTTNPGFENNQKYNFNKQSDEDKEFINKVRQYRILFETGKFNELEDLIDKLNNESSTKEYKFNFTFDKYKFGDGNTAYIVRCIDNKTEFDYSQSNNSFAENETEKQKIYRHQKAKIESLKDMYEITNHEKLEMGERLNDYLKLSMEDKEFAKNLSVVKDEIANTSKIFGYKKEDNNVEDENSSQSSQAGFNDNIARKSRIEEIRSNIMQNVSNFYSLKWIKAIFYFIILMTAAFCGFYLMIFDIVYNDLNNISSLNIGLFQSTIWICNIISSLISMRSTYNYALTGQPLKYYYYMDNSTAYFEALRGFTSSWYNVTMLNFGSIEQQINFYFKLDQNDLFWTQKDITYPNLKTKISDNESFGATIAQILSGTNQLMKNPFFSGNLAVLKSSAFTNHSKDFVDYSAFMAIENAIDNLLPRQFEILNSAPTVFKDENNGNIRFVIIIILGYSFAILLMIFLYTILLYLTNKNMEEGLEKVSKIKLERIDETIKKIESFNDKCLSKYRQKETKSATDETKDVKNDANNNTSNNNNPTQIKEAYQKIFSEGQKYKSLRVLSYSYLQIIIIIIICCAILIPIYFVSLGMIDSSNQILSVQNYIFGKSLTASASTVNIKCIISECKTKQPLSYNVDFVDRANIESIVRDIGNFPELSNFYSNKFLLNACAVIFPQDLNNTDYVKCMNDVVIKSANNTDSLLKLVDETVATIIKDKEMKANTEVILKDNTTAIFSNPLLFETKNFRDLEYIFYNYITPISDNFSSVVSLSLNDYLLAEKVKIIILISVFAICILLFSFYIAFIFTKKLIHLLSVARVILRIIPTSVINNTQDLETWIENKY